MVEITALPASNMYLGWVGLPGGLLHSYFEVVNTSSLRLCAHPSSYEYLARPQVLISAAVGTVSTQKNVVDLWWNTTFLAADGEPRPAFSNPGCVPCDSRSV